MGTLSMLTLIFPLLPFKPAEPSLDPHGSGQHFDALAPDLGFTAGRVMNPGDPHFGDPESRLVGLGDEFHQDLKTVGPRIERRQDPLVKSDKPRLSIHHIEVKQQAREHRVTTAEDNPFEWVLRLD